MTFTFLVFLIFTVKVTGYHAEQSELICSKKPIVALAVHGGEDILPPADGRGLSSGAVAGIVIAVIVGLAGIGIGLFVWMRRKNAEQNAGDDGGRSSEDDDQVNIPLNDLGDNADN
ncbi:hypothetical protein D9C73_026726 [Collichthys lucidus]|uniref:Uncharacterized protein n=1 Tax=Collichthys lucidus TaxID=240159 RepID=A0A4U5VWQ6_COLLU|nr:hypothetical protein D9C73_026726 [Collichthys lucidus]